MHDAVVVSKTSGYLLSLWPLAHLVGLYKAKDVSARSCFSAGKLARRRTDRQSIRGGVYGADCSTSGLNFSMRFHAFVYSACARFGPVYLGS